MKEKIVLHIDRTSNMVYDNEDNYIGTLIGSADKLEDNSIADVVLALVKQGLSAEDIVKLRNADLL